MSNIEKLALRLSKNKAQTPQSVPTPAPTPKKSPLLKEVPEEEQIDIDEEDNPLVDEVEDDFDEEEEKPKEEPKAEIKEEPKAQTLSKEEELNLLHNNGVYRAELLFRFDTLNDNLKELIKLLRE